MQQVDSVCQFSCEHVSSRKNNVGVAMGEQQQQQAASACPVARHLSTAVRAQRQPPSSTKSRSSCVSDTNQNMTAFPAGVLLLLSSMLQALMPPCVLSRLLAMRWQG
jgi:hypothetical protein